jgi:hypothetical protein
MGKDKVWDGSADSMGRNRGKREKRAAASLTAAPLKAEVEVEYKEKAVEQAEEGGAEKQVPSRAEKEEEEKKSAAATPSPPRRRVPKEEEEIEAAPVQPETLQKRGGVSKIAGQALRDQLQALHRGSSHSSLSTQDLTDKETALSSEASSSDSEWVKVEETRKAAVPATDPCQKPSSACGGRGGAPASRPAPPHSGHRGYGIWVPEEPREAAKDLVKELDTALMEQVIAPLDKGLAAFGKGRERRERTGTRCGDEEDEREWIGGLG